MFYKQHPPINSHENHSAWNNIKLNYEYSQAVRSKNKSEGRDTIQQLETFMKDAGENHGD